MEYRVYILQCADGTLYTGVTTDLTRRLAEHNYSAKGAIYTRSRRPVTLRYSEEQPDRSAAQKREHELRKLSRDQKLILISSPRVHGTQA